MTLPSSQPSTVEHLKTVSLSRELTELRHAIEGARLLAETLALEELPSKRMTREAPGLIAAMLSVVVARLHLLGSVIYGNQDPQLLWAPHNATEPEGREWEAGDVRFSAWGASDAQTTRKEHQHRMSAAEED